MLGGISLPPSLELNTCGAASTIIPSSSSSSPFYSASLLEQSQSAPAVGIEAFICVHTPCPPLRPAKKASPPSRVTGVASAPPTGYMYIFLSPSATDNGDAEILRSRCGLPSFPGFALCPFSPFPLSLFTSQGHSEEGAMHSVQNCKTEEEEEEDAAAAGGGGRGGRERVFRSARWRGEVGRPRFRGWSARHGTTAQCKFLGKREGLSAAQRTF